MVKGALHFVIISGLLSITFIFTSQNWRSYGFDGWGRLKYFFVCMPASWHNINVDETVEYSIPDQHLFCFLKGFSSNGGSLVHAGSSMGADELEKGSMRSLNLSSQALEASHWSYSTSASAFSSLGSSSDAKIRRAPTNLPSTDYNLPLFSFNKSLLLHLVILSIHCLWAAYFTLPSEQWRRSHSRRALWFWPRKYCPVAILSCLCLFSVIIWLCIRTLSSSGKRWW